MKSATRVRLGSKLRGGVDRMCNCGHTAAAHLPRLAGRCWDHAICGCEGFYPEGLKSDEGHEATKADDKGDAA